MPMIPSGRVDLATKERPARIAESVELASLPAAPQQEDDYCMLPDGSIDNKAETNRMARMVADALQEEIDCTDPTFCAGIVILAGQYLRYRFGQVSDFTGLPRRFCKRVINNLGYNRLLFNRELAGDLPAEVEKEDGAVDLLFALYCLAGSGVIRHDKGRWFAMPKQDVQFYMIVSVNDE